MKSLCFPKTVFLLLVFACFNIEGSCFLPSWISLGKCLEKERYVFLNLNSLLRTSSLLGYLMNYTTIGRIFPISRLPILCALSMLMSSIISNSDEQISWIPSTCYTYKHIYHQLRWNACTLWRNVIVRNVRLNVRLKVLLHVSCILEGFVLA